MMRFGGWGGGRNQSALTSTGFLNRLHRVVLALHHSADEIGDLLPLRTSRWFVCAKREACMEAVIVHLSPPLLERVNQLSWCFVLDLNQAGWRQYGVFCDAKP